MDKIFQKFEGAKLALAVRHPFWYFLLQSIRVTYNPNEDADMIVEPCGIIFGKRIEDKNIMKALINGMYHIIQGHPIRKNKYAGSPYIFDLACEVKRCIDLDDKLYDASMIKVVAEKNNWHKKSVEEIARDLENKGMIEEHSINYLVTKNVRIVLRGQMSQTTEEVILNEGENVQDLEQNFEEVYKNILGKVIEAKIFSDMAGRGEPLADRIVESLTAKKELWFKVLEMAIKEHFRKTLMTYQKTSRRDVNLPGRKWYGGRLWVLVDVSGSISDEEYKRFCETIYGMVKAGIEVIFVKWDTEAEVVGTVKNLGDLMKKAKVRGYGGTTPDCLLSVLDKFKQNDVAVILTDGCWVDYRKFAKWVRGKKVMLVTNGKVPDGVEFWKVVEIR